MKSLFEDDDNDLTETHHGNKAFQGVHEEH